MDKTCRLLPSGSALGAYGWVPCLVPAAQIRTRLTQTRPVSGPALLANKQQPPALHGWAPLGPLGTEA